MNRPGHAGLMLCDPRSLAPVAELGRLLPCLGGLPMFIHPSLDLLATFTPCAWGCWFGASVCRVKSPTPVGPLPPFQVTLSFTESNFPKVSRSKPSACPRSVPPFLGSARMPCGRPRGGGERPDSRWFTPKVDGTEIDNNNTSYISQTLHVRMAYLHTLGLGWVPGGPM